MIFSEIFQKDFRTSGGESLQYFVTPNGETQENNLNTSTFSWDYREQEDKIMTANSPHVFTYDASDAINLTPPSQGGLAGSALKIDIPAGKYSLSVTGTMYYAGNNLDKVKQLVLFNTKATLAPSEDNSLDWLTVIYSDPENLFFVNVKENASLYVFLVDQWSTNDNSGSVTLTFNKVSV